MGSTAVSLNNTPLVPVFNSSQPCEGPIVLSLFLDFTAAQSYVIDARPYSDKGSITIAQTLYADTTGCTQNMTVQVDRTQQVITIKPNVQGFFPIVAPNPFRLTFTCTGGPVGVHIMVLNVAVQPGQWATVPAAGAPVTSVFGRTGAVVAASGDYTAAQVTNAVDQTVAYTNPAWISSISWSKVTGAPAFLTSLTPWTSNINGGNFILTNAAGISVGTAANPVVGAVDIPAYNTTNSQVRVGSIELQPYALNNCFMSDNLYYNGGWLYRNTGFGEQITFVNGTINLRSAPSGTGGTAAAPVTWLTILNNGNVGLGNGANPTHVLELIVDSAAKPTTSAWTISSGAAVKKDIKDLEGGLSIIDQLRPTEAKYNGLCGTPDNERVVSCIAEEVEKVLPGCVTHTEVDGNDVLGFNPHEILFHLILAVQEIGSRLKAIEGTHGHSRNRPR